VKQGTQLFVEFEDKRDAEDVIHFENGRKIIGSWTRSCKDKKSGRDYD